MKTKLFLFSLITAFYVCYNVNAQMFDDENNNTSYSSTTIKNSNNGQKKDLFISSETPKNDASKNFAKDTNGNLKLINTKEKGANAKTQKQEAVLSEKNSQITPKKALTSDVKQYKIIDGKQVEEDAGEAIYFYYKDFKMVRNIGRTACDVRFVLVTRLAETLSNISMRVVWPNLATKISYDGVTPGVETYADYRFYGDGCYSLDKLPNITINRCRLKGRTQKECASLVKLMRWVDD